MAFDNPIVIQKIEEGTEVWTDLFGIHASVNKFAGGKRTEYLSAGVNQSKSRKVFEIRYFKALEDIDMDRGSYRIVYRGNFYNIADYDDYLERHQTVKLLGESY